MTPKQAPPGVLENYLGWMKPAVAGLHDARYPSLVGVIIINGNLPRPERLLARSRRSSVTSRAIASSDLGRLW